MMNTAIRIETEYSSAQPLRHLEYPSLTMFQMISRVADHHPDEPAYEFYDLKTSYSRFIHCIEDAARALLAAGIKGGDRVTLCLPNIPQALDAFYAVNRIGATANMIHPLSSEDEIAHYLTVAKSPLIITVDMFYEKVRAALSQVKHPVRIAVVRIQDRLPLHLRALYILRSGRQYLKYPSGNDILWTDLLKKGVSRKLPEVTYDPSRTAAILYSGGTSGLPKGVCLSDLNFNACGMQAKEFIQQELRPGLSILACMPMFHGFGLGINIHAVLIHGGCCILMPTFNIKTYASMILKKRPNYIAGVPTIFDALLNTDRLKNADLSHLLGMFCGGDTLPVDLKHRVDAFLKEHGAGIQIREGYGLTECVTASCLTPKDVYREHSIGLPFPDTYYDIVKPGTDIACPPGTKGEIVLKGPTLMQGYLDDPEETARTCRRRSDGDVWLYTGDLGYMDEDGYIYFLQRIKRMIITNGYNIYPTVLEDALDSLDEVAMSCVIGVKDPRRGQKVVAYIVLKKGETGDDAMKEQILSRLRKKVAAYALPKEIIFRDELPKTLVGKVAYHVLEEESQRSA